MGSSAGWTVGLGCSLGGLFVEKTGQQANTVAVLLLRMSSVLAFGLLTQSKFVTYSTKHVQRPRLCQQNPGK